MIYSVDLTIPAQTGSARLARQSQAVGPGECVQQFLTFPDGCAGLAFARVVVREQVLWPTNPDAWFHSNNITLQIGDRFEIDGSGEVFRLEGYNDDQLNPHTITLVLVVVPREPVSLSDLLNRQPVFAGSVGQG